MEKLAADLSAIYPKKSVDYGLFCEIYPIHPATLEFLEEVRDRFSKSRGIVDFALTQLLGNEARNISPFLDQDWGHLLTPDVIVDHFSDLFEVQPEFLAIAQKVLPYFRKQIPAFYKSKNTEYVTNQKLDNHELVRLLAPLLDHHPTPERAYQHLGAPVYGLVPDQIHLLLIMLLIQGEIDIVKGDSSYRETYDTLGDAHDGAD